MNEVLRQKIESALAEGPETAKKSEVLAALAVDRALEQRKTEVRGSIMLIAAIVAAVAAVAAVTC